jgi:hypothetical protein
MRAKITGTVTLALALAAFTAGRPAQADEGMWTFNNFPAAKMQAKYGWAPDAAWLQHVQLSTLRLAEGCTASFISPDGLVMTNHHCARGCIGALSDAKHDYIATGFYAAALKEERRCPDMEADQLTGIEDVTAKIRNATDGKSGKAFIDAERGAIAEVENKCQTSAALRCEVVTLYHGGEYDLYTYKRYQDLRLVWSVEDDAANFGGDPDNFNFPRYDIDVSFLRVYDHGKPLHTENYFKFAPQPVQAGDIVFTAGNPGSTDRGDTVAQLDFQRDVALPTLIALLSQDEGILWEMSREGAEPARIARTSLFFTQNSLKAFKGEEQALVDGPILAQKTAEQRALEQKIAADPKLADAKGAWPAIAQAMQAQRQIFLPYLMLDRLPNVSRLMHQAILLDRYASQSQKPDGQRLEEYTQANFPALKEEIGASEPVYSELEKTQITWWLTELRAELGADSPYVHTVLGKQSPEQIADMVVDGTKLGSAKVRAQLLAGGPKAIDASQDPLLAFARRLDGPAMAVLNQYDNEVKAVVTQNAARIARARFALYGHAIYPDATFTLRLSYGTVKGYTQNGQFVQPFTTFAGAYARATGNPPFKLPASWLKAEPKIDTATDLDMASTNDIVGGNSGSPVIDRNGDVTGLIFDGDIQSLGGDFGYDPAVNRAVAVDATALKLALTKIYHDERLVKELGLQSQGS